ncbi:DUF2441 domain-containing protein [Phyllobacterium lublinensis]|uniref:DUF2441 domain-containing protein n=1 Tax=Phyllobacterium lublinensis TaxID=2875708 RepID=UPI001CC8F892|nr:DUF2441 domain-containing protein [Phyllobacterium sp. 2063]MBZ9655030.1 DUF2441 domain-containing protein [Phyllobacterium sp. 2063]
MTPLPKGIENVSYWHLAEKNGMMLHNAFLAKGHVVSVSLVARAPGLSQVTTSYAFGHRDAEKERLWEEVRSKDFPNLPSRMRCLYAFITKGDAERANKEWFNSNRAVLELYLVDANTHIADSKFLDANSETWGNRALDYWLGDTTDDPRFEVLIHGRVFLPGWDREPFEMMKP